MPNKEIEYFIFGSLRMTKQVDQEVDLKSFLEDIYITNYSQMDPIMRRFEYDVVPCNAYGWQVVIKKSPDPIVEDVKTPEIKISEKKQFVRSKRKASKSKRAVFKTKTSKEVLVFKDYISHYGKTRLAYITTVISSMLYNRNKNGKVSFNRRFEKADLQKKLVEHYGSNSPSLFKNMIDEFCQSEFCESVFENFITIKSEIKIKEICEQEFNERMGTNNGFTLNTSYLNKEDLKKINIKRFSYDGYKEVRTQIEYRKPFMENKEDYIPYYNCHTIAKLLNVSESTISNHIKNLNKYYCWQVVKKSYEFFHPEDIKEFRKKLGGFFQVVKYENSNNETLFFLYRLNGISIPNQDVFKFKNGSVTFQEKSKKYASYCILPNGGRAKEKNEKGKTIYEPIRNYKNGRIKTYSEGIISYDQHQKEKLLDKKSEKRKKLILQNYPTPDIVFNKGKLKHNKSIDGGEDIRVQGKDLLDAQNKLNDKRLCKKLDPNKNKLKKPKDSY